MTYRDANLLLLVLRGGEEVQARFQGAGDEAVQGRQALGGTACRRQWLHGNWARRDKRWWLGSRNRWKAHAAAAMPDYRFLEKG